LNRDDSQNFSRSAFPSYDDIRNNTMDADPSKQIRLHSDDVILVHMFATSSNANKFVLAYKPQNMSTEEYIERGLLPAFCAILVHNDAFFLVLSSK